MIEYDIKNSLKNNECPICGAVREGMSKIIWWFKTENYHEHSTLESLREHPYICEKHKNQIIDMGDHLSTTFEFLIKGDIRILQALQRTGKRGFKKEVKRLSAPECRFCLNEKNIERHAIETFAEMLKDEALRELYEHSSGLCRRHLFTVMEAIGEKDERTLFLIEDTTRRLTKLKNLFESFFHKLDYRFSHEEKGEEQTAWLTALKFYSED